MMTGTESATPTFVFIDRKHQGHDGKGWSQSKGEDAYVQDVEPKATERPESWTGAYVIERLIEAFKTDRYLRLPRPRETGGSHPQTIYTEDDRFGWLEIPEADKVIVIGPSKEHFERMEEAFGWLHERNMELKMFARRRALKLNWAAICRDHGWNKDTAKGRAIFQSNRVADILTLCRSPVM